MATLGLLTTALLACLGLITVAPHCPARTVRAALGTTAALLIASAYIAVLFTR